MAVVVGRDRVSGCFDSLGVGGEHLELAGGGILGDEVVPDPGGGGGGADYPEARACAPGIPLRWLDARDESGFVEQRVDVLGGRRERVVVQLLDPVSHRVG